MKDYASIARAYCEDVVAGRVIACRWTRKACARHLADLAKQGSEDFPYYFSPKHGNRICKFAEMLPHVKGRWTRKRELLRLEPWQVFILVSIFGWLKVGTKFRRFSTALVYVPRKNGKSFLAAVIGLYCLKFDNEPGAEVVCGATTETQANYVFRPAQQIVSRTTALRQLGLQTLARAVVDPVFGSRMDTCIGQPLDGSNPSCALLDEAHEWSNDLLLTTMQTGMMAREQPLIVITTTAGYNIAGPAKLMQDDLQAVLEGTMVNEELFGVIFTADPDVDWRSELALRQANPNYGVSVDAQKLKSEQHQAIQSPRKQVAFKTKHLNLWTNTAVEWMDPDKWNACGDPTLKIEDFAGETCFAGLDAASKLDLTAYVRIFQRTIGGKQHYYLFPIFYLPAAQVDIAGNGHYQQWAANGHLQVVPGAVNDQAALKEQIFADAKQFHLAQVAHDPYGITELITALTDSGLTANEMQQKWQLQSGPMKELEALVIAGRIHHPANPVLTWCIANTLVKNLPNNVIVPRKESPTSPKKIDGTVATIMALRQAMLGMPKPNTIRYTGLRSV